jgi:uncharacterized protein (DUF2164 family)
MEKKLLKFLNEAIDAFDSDIDFDKVTELDLKYYTGMRDAYKMVKEYIEDISVDILPR